MNSTLENTSAKLAFADAVLKAEEESALLTSIGAEVVRLAKLYRAGQIRAKSIQHTPQGPRLSANVDGGSRGNPGPSGAGVVIRNSAGASLYEAANYLGELKTCNEAEWLALIHAARAAAGAGASELTVFMDSKLVASQVSGSWKIKSASMRTLCDEARSILKQIPRWRVTHVRREFNSEADALTNRAMDARSNTVFINELKKPA